jgi:alpha-glucosidase
MQWNDLPFAGFSTIQPWLPVHPDYTRRNVGSQQSDPRSLFNFTKKLLTLRKEIPALVHGNFIPLETQRSLMVYMRQTEAQSVIVVLNFNGQNAKFLLPDGDWQMLITSDKGVPGVLAPFEIQMYLSPKKI